MKEVFKVHIEHAFRTVVLFGIFQNVLVRQYVLHADDITKGRLRLQGEINALEVRAELSLQGFQVVFRRFDHPAATAGLSHLKSVIWTLHGQ